jgi:uncharacterized protein YutE (UPF0331/DUF86 family)
MTLLKKKSKHLAEPLEFLQMRETLVQFPENPNNQTQQTTIAKALFHFLSLIVEILSDIFMVIAISCQKTSCHTFALVGDWGLGIGENYE